MKDSLIFNYNCTLTRLNSIILIILFFISFTNCIFILYLYVPVQLRDILFSAGILSVIMDAYLDGKIDDALLVPVTLNYDKLVDGNFVREQLGMPKQMETFWSALRGIWRTLNTNHGSIRVDFNQPISLKVC